MKKLCKIKKNDYESFKEEIIKKIKKPKFYCKKCFRVAKTKKLLCSSETLKM